VEIPGVVSDRLGTIQLHSGATLTLDVVVVSQSGERVRLRDEHVLTFGPRSFVSASSPLLKPDGSKAPLEFAQVFIRSRPDIVATVYWLSYDPRDFKDGAAFPGED